MALDGERLPSSILVPLVVISQLAQYRAFNDSQDAMQAQLTVGETVGFCIGLLSALAVSVLHECPDTVFTQNAAVAVRLAMLAGCIVDQQQQQDLRGPSKTFSVAWKRDEPRDSYKDLECILAKFPDVSLPWQHEPSSSFLHFIRSTDSNTISVQAYVSVAYDTTRVSLTTTISALEPLQHALQNAGFAITELALSGRFHSKSDHHNAFESVINFCEKNPAFMFPTSTLRIPSRMATDDPMLRNQISLHHTALQSILLQRCDWYSVVSERRSSYLSDTTSFVSFGERCIPTSLLSGLSGRLTYFDDTTAPILRSNPNEIAVIGVSINVAGASSVTDFWDLLVPGKSQHKLVSEDKFTFETTFRENDPSRKWYGNFIDGVEDFDHKFFNKTPRESTGMDPQQRSLLQCAYQAVEMSGYFNDNNDANLKVPAAESNNTGCYIGMCGNDYVANTSPNAFTATGTLRSFVAGKLSHYFGWLGPSLTLDTACSASAVAIHMACRAILSGEVTAALAGGTNTISEPGVYQNLAGASFLSPTGPCKFMDTKADGYCRGEAVSAVFLKSLAQARKDGDVVIGVISGTAVAQNSNDTPIVVPNAPSLSTLFNSVLQTAKLDAQDISVVEAHGTGTPVGDPAEYAAIRRVFGQEEGNGIKRPIPLQLGSVKGLVGHTEGSSGVVSLVKVLCMLHEAAIPPQASHSVMNPAIWASKSDGIHISLQLKPWNANFKAALINNYGASGSNASMIVSQAPKVRLETIATGQSGQDESDLRYPFWFAGLDDRSIRAYTAKLRDYLKKKPQTRIADLAFNISRQSNHTLPRALFLSARSVSDLTDKLIGLENTATASIDVPASRPVILCFGGQLSTTINFDRSVYENTALLRQHMNRCNDIAIMLGAGSIYPAVFQSSPIADIVLLQTALFAVQYSTAQCWISSGVKPAAFIGHSFGELTAMCISGVLGLKDALKMVIRRATLIRDDWSTEKGSMLVMDGNEEEAVREGKEELPEKLYTFTGYQDTKQSFARFRINTMIPMYQNIVAGHTIAGVASICPATVQIDVVIEAVKSLSQHLSADGMQPQIRSMVNLVPVCVDVSRSVWLDLEALNPSRTTWSWKWTSTGSSGTMPTTHVSGEIHFRDSNDVHYQSEFSRYGRLVSHRRCMKILHHENPDEVLQGQRSIYRVFSPIVNYSPLYFGLQKLVGLGSESAGQVVKKHSGDSWLDAFLSDAFCEVAGIWVNCMAEESESDMWIANGIEDWARAPTITEAQTRSIEKWHVFGQHSRSADGNSILSDVFIFDAATGALTEAILGIQYAKVPRVSMGKLLSRLTRDARGAAQAPVSKPVPPVLMASAEFPTLPTPSGADLKIAQVPVKQSKDTPSDVVKRLKAILADISGLEVDEIKSNVELADIGVDSLMGMEMAREIETEFKCALPQDELVHVTNFPELLHCLESALGVTTGSPDTTSSSSSPASSSGDAYEDTAGSITPLSVPDEGNGISSFPFDLESAQTAAIKAFSESKLETDQLMKKYGALGYLRTIAPQQDQFCVTLVVEAFLELGCNLGAATAGEELSFIPHAGDQKKFAQYLYTVLETARVVDLNDGKITRTHVPVATRTSSDLLRELLDKYPEHACCNELAYWTGSQLASILTGEKDGIKLIFGTERGCELVGAVYADFPLNKLYYDQMGDFLRRLASSTSRDAQKGPLKIVEMGAGTGGTTNNLLPLLASLGVNIEYTLRDLAPSFVAAARKRYKQYSFMKFRTHDIEKEPAEDLLQSQHVVIASNAVHATRSLPVSTANIRKMLRSDGVLLLLEMTEPMYWCDIIFGVFEGWWLFEDGRQHAVAPPETWEKVLHSVGYGHMDWSDGHAEEVKCERLIMATATGKQFERLPTPSKPRQVEVCKIRVSVE